MTGKTTQPSKYQLESKIKSLQAQVESTKADCAILLKENIELIALCEKFIKGFQPAKLFTSQFRTGEEEPCQERLKELVAGDPDPALDPDPAPAPDPDPAPAPQFHEYRDLSNSQLIIMGHNASVNAERKQNSLNDLPKVEKLPAFFAKVHICEENLLLKCPDCFYGEVSGYHITYECDTCNGFGFLEPYKVTCDTCEGKPKEYRQKKGETCPFCKERGYMIRGKRVDPAKVAQIILQAKAKVKTGEYRDDGYLDR